MASPAQCFYCFECLAASYKRQEPIDLDAVGELAERYEQSKKISSLHANNDLGQQIAVEGGEVDKTQHESSHSKNNRPNAINLPSTSRIQSQPSSDSSSTATTPSAASTNSSRSMLSTSTAVTTPGSSTTVSEVTEGTRKRSRDQRYPLFVTWNILFKNGHKSLRGCIGSFEAQELSDGLKEYALTSAFDDTRFSPIPESLLPSLSCSLTLLGSFEPCTDALDWLLSVHGIRISFIHCGRRHGATYLPDVAVEEGWTKEETLENLMRKAGWNGPTSGNITRRLLRGSSNSNGHSESGKPWEQVSDFRVVRYQGLNASASYAEWQDWRQWVLSLKDGSELLLRPTSR